MRSMLNDPLLGRVIDGKYRVDAKIGAGGMATIYRAMRLHIGDAVAIKMLLVQLLREPQFAERFRREAQVAASLKHPNVVAIHDFGVSGDGIIYLVMELVEGRDLRAFIHDLAPVEPKLAAEIIREVCAALDEAHRRHVVHRDVKPANVMVASTPAGHRVKVLDFGIASLRTGSAGAALTQTGMLLGTPAYTSPEQWLGEELDGRADIYSLGVVLFEMLCGVVPFNSPIATAVAMQHVQQTPPPLRVLNASISPAVEAVVLRALAKQREDRFQTAREFAEALANAVDASRPSPHAETLVTQISPATQVWATTVQSSPDPSLRTPRSRRRLAMGIVAAAAIMLGMVLAWLVVQHSIVKPGRPTARESLAPGVVAYRAKRTRVALPLATVSAAAMAGPWRLDESNAQIGQISWVGEATPSATDTIVFDVRKRSIAGHAAVPCERETHLHIEFSAHVAAQTVPFREVNCEGVATMGEVQVVDLFRSSRTFSGSFWEDGSKIGDFNARKL